MSSHCRVIVLTKNPGSFAKLWVEAYQNQKTKFDVLIIDSGSTDGCREVFGEAGFEIEVIDPAKFNHGGTRQLGMELSEGYEFLIYMTQDALLASPTALEDLLKPFADPLVAAVCGRQLPHIDASPLATHARTYSYPEVSHVHAKDDISRVGVKAAFLSDSFAAYRRSALLEVGGFPSKVIFGEDFQVACKFLQAGLKVAYCAEATVRHSHNYSPAMEFRRYFDVGVSHREDYWMIEMLGSAGGAGLKFMLSELKFLAKTNPWWVPRSVLHTGLKYTGYKLGLRYHLLSKSWRKKVSYDRGYWERPVERVESVKKAPSQPAMS
jgi:rhamnosyltransferase